MTLTPLFILTALVWRAFWPTRLHGHPLGAGRGHAPGPDASVGVQPGYRRINPVRDLGGLARGHSHAAAFDGCRRVRTGRPDTAAVTIRVISWFLRIPAAPSRSICTDTPGARDSG